LVHHCTVGFESTASKIRRAEPVTHNASPRGDRPVRANADPRALCGAPKLLYPHAATICTVHLDMHTASMLLIRYCESLKTKPYNLSKHKRTLSHITPHASASKGDRPVRADAGPGAKQTARLPLANVARSSQPGSRQPGRLEAASPALTSQGAYKQPPRLSPATGDTSSQPGSHRPGRLEAASPAPASQDGWKQPAWPSPARRGQIGMSSQPGNPVSLPTATTSSQLFFASQGG
jgi:hypothetical protein